MRTRFLVASATISCRRIHELSLLIHCGLEVSVIDAGTTGFAATPETVPNLTGVTAISLTEGLCAIVAGGAVECSPAGNEPALVPGVTATAIAGDCALTPSGSIQCWGNLRWRPDAGGVSALEGGGFTSLSDDSYSACAVQGPGGTSITCWGYNDTGQLGGGLPIEGGPFAVPGLTGVASVAIGGSDIGFACALLKDGTVQCWGDNQHGELGNGTTNDSSSGPVLVPQ
ncbi:MAG TPA: hypothetical protein VH853_19060 [Polyangia bacterium]|nr:hypothetical protein [Polyangia bacterium]